MHFSNSTGVFGHRAILIWGVSRHGWGFSRRTTCNLHFLTLNDLKNAILRRIKPCKSGRVTELLAQPPTITHPSAPHRHLTKPSGHETQQSHPLPKAPPLYRLAPAQQKSSVGRHDEARLLSYTSTSEVESMCGENFENFPKLLRALFPQRSLVSHACSGSFPRSFLHITHCLRFAYCI